MGQPWGCRGWRLPARGRGCVECRRRSRPNCLCAQANAALTARCVIGKLTNNLFIWAPSNKEVHIEPDVNLMSQSAYRRTAYEIEGNESRDILVETANTIVKTAATVKFYTKVALT